MIVMVVWSCIGSLEWFFGMALWNGSRLWKELMGSFGAAVTLYIHCCYAILLIDDCS